MKFNIITLMILFLLTVKTWAHKKNYEILSPDRKVKIEVSSSNQLLWSIYFRGEMLTKPSPIEMRLNNGISAGIKPVIEKVKKRSSNNTVIAIIPVRNANIPDQYNELRIILEGGFAVVFRAYNDGVAYRFESNLKDDVVEVLNEIADLNFNEDCDIYFPEEKNPEMQSHYEGKFKLITLSGVNPGQYGYLPLYLRTRSGTRMVVTESDLYDYPNEFMFGTGGNTLKAAYPKVILKDSLRFGSDRAQVTVKKADYIARTKGTRVYPWRTIVISEDDKSLLETDLVYKLASPNVIANTSWIKPGKVAWDWWNANNIYGVDFKSGINTPTYKYYIDFAAEYGLKYIILDEGWSASTTNLLAPVRELDIEEVIKYGKSKNVGVILWALWQPLDRNMDQILDQFVVWGAAGIKVDFMARADQYMVNFYERTAKAAAKRKLLVDLHGAYKPVGLNRKYPNVVNYEGVSGLENNKWDETITPDHNTTLPFTRMVAGPMDYTPGAMINSTKKNFHINYTEPMSMGTRAHQGAMYVIYDGPLQMLADNPSNYKRDPDFTHFIAQIPTTWDKTIGLAGDISKYVVTARKKGDKWYLAAMTNWDARKLTINLPFLKNARYKMEILQDGTNADRHASDYKLLKDQPLTNQTITINMAPGGGWVAALTPDE